MKFLKTIFLVSLFALFVASCTNDSEGDLTIFMNDHGTLVYTITDSEEKPVEGAVLYVFDMDFFSVGEFSSLNMYEFALKKVETDEAGKADFGTLNKGLYFIHGEVEADGGKLYEVNKIVQVHSGIDSELNISLAEYIGSVSLNVRSATYNSFNGTEYAILDSINLVLVPMIDGVDMVYMSFSSLLYNGFPIGVTDQLGNLKADQIPLGEYYVLAYYDENRFDLLSTSTSSNSARLIEIKMGESSIQSLYAESDKVKTKIPVKTGFYVYYTETNTTTYLKDTTYLKEVKVLLSSSSSSSFSSAYSSRVLELTSDQNGFASLNDNLDYSYYYIWVYSDMQTYKRIGQFYQNDILSREINLEVTKTNFHKTYGKVNVNARGKYISGLTIDTMLMDDVTLRLTTSTSAYFSNTNSGYEVNTDAQGNAMFENVPIGNYYLWAYSDETHAERSIFIINVKEDETTEIKAVFDAEKALILTGNISLQFYSVTGGVEKKMANAYVILSLNTNSSVSNALTNAYRTGTTDEYGQITFKDLQVNTNFYTTVYYDLERYSYSYTAYKARYKSEETFRVKVDNRMN